MQRVQTVGSAHKSVAAHLQRSPGVDADEIAGIVAIG